MKKPSLQRLIQLQRNNQLLKDHANDLANQLIIEFDINEGNKIAYFLKVSQDLDNYSAVRRWVEKWLKQQYPLTDDNAMYAELKHDDGLYPQIKQQFLTHFPASCVAWKRPVLQYTG